MMKIRLQIAKRTPIFIAIFLHTSLHAPPCKSCQNYLNTMNNHKRHRFISWLRTPPVFAINHNTLRTATCVPEENQQQLPISIFDLMLHTFKHTIPEHAYVPLPHAKQVLHIRKGLCIHQKPLVAIFSRGYAKKTYPTEQEPFIQKGGGISGAFNLFRDNIITQIPCITFDYPDERDFFNFGQVTDYACLKYIYEKTVQANPHAQILLIGDCRGAKVALDFATENPPNLAGLILFSPFFSAQGITRQLAKNYLGFLPFKEKILHVFFRSYYPNYEPIEKNLFDRIPSIQPHLPIFIGHRFNDALVSNEEMYYLLDVLKNSGHTKLSFKVIHDQSAPHSRLTPHKEIQQAVKSFLQNNHLQNCFIAS